MYDSSVERLFKLNLYIKFRYITGIHCMGTKAIPNLDKVPETHGHVLLVGHPVPGMLR